MSLKKRIVEDLTKAIKQGDKLRLGVLRMLKARMVEAEVELRAQRGRDYELNDGEVTDVLTSYAKQRRQSIDSYRQAERHDLAGREKAELAIIHEYLPEQLSEEDVARIVDEAIAETGARSEKDLGPVMRVVMPRVKGAADGSFVNELVRNRLRAGGG